MLAGGINGSQVQGVVAFANIEGAAIHLDALDDAGDEDIGVGVAVAMGVGGEVIGQEVFAHLEKLGDGLAVISGHTGCEILRRLDAAGGRLDGIAGNGDGRARPSGIGVEQIGAGEDFDGGIG